MNETNNYSSNVAVKLWSIHINNFSIFHHSTRWWWTRCLRRRWWCCCRTLIQPGQRWNQVLERKVAKLSKHFLPSQVPQPTCSSVQIHVSWVTWLIFSCWESWDEKNYFEVMNNLKNEWRKFSKSLSRTNNVRRKTMLSLIVW